MWQKHYSHNKTTTHKPKKGKNVGDPAQQNFISKLPANAVEGAIGYKLLPLLQTN